MHEDEIHSPEQFAAAHPHFPPHIPSQKPPKVALICFAVFALVSTVTLICSSPFAHNFGHTWPAGLLCFSLLGAFSSLGVYPIYRSQARLARQAVQGIEAGQYLVRWRYTPQFWQAWRQQTQTAAKMSAKNAVTLLVVIVLGYGAIVAYSTTLTNVGSRHITLWTGSIILLIASLIPIGMLARAYRQRALSRTSHLACITKEAVYIDGAVSAYADPFYKLQSITVKAGPISHIEFVFYHPGGARTGSISIHRRIPVPPGNEPLAKQIASILHQTYPGVG